MTRQPPKTTYLDQWLKPEHFVFWQGRIYQVERPAEAEADPLTIWLRDVDSTELKDVRVEQLLLSPRDDGQMAPLFAPSLEKLRPRTPSSDPARPRGELAGETAAAGGQGHRHG